MSCIRVAVPMNWVGENEHKRHIDTDRVKDCSPESCQRFIFKGWYLAHVLSRILISILTSPFTEYPCFSENLFCLFLRKVSACIWLFSPFLCAERGRLGLRATPKANTQDKHSQVLGSGDVRLTSFGRRFHACQVLPSRCVHACPGTRILSTLTPSLTPSYQCLILCVSHNLSTGGRLGCVHLLAIVNSCAMNVTACVFFWVTSFQLFGGTVLGVQLLVNMVILCLTFWGATKMFSTVQNEYFIFLPAMYKGSNYSTVTSVFIFH